jgi:plasmid stability protein
VGAAVDGGGAHTVGELVAANGVPGRIAFDGRCSTAPSSVMRQLAQWRSWRHYGAMAKSIQIKDVPDETHAVLRRRAAAARQSLQEYLRSRLIAEASAPTVEEVLERAGGRAGGSVPFAAATELLREERARR